MYVNDVNKERISFNSGFLDELSTNTLSLGEVSYFVASLLSLMKMYRRRDR